jgi:ribonuclease HII
LAVNPLQRHDADLLAAYTHLVGVDEAGRGCLAGPVMAAAVVVDRRLLAQPELRRATAAFHDSKQLTAEQREAQYAVLSTLCQSRLVGVALGEASVDAIAELNILGATRLAMRRALEKLADGAERWRLPDAYAETPLFPDQSGVKLLVDGRPLRPFPYAHEGLVKGDGRSLVVAMASIAAKVQRDRLMQELDEQYPGYGLGRHKGYGTPAHVAAIRARGPSPVHRELFLRRILRCEDG